MGSKLLLLALALSLLACEAKRDRHCPSESQSLARVLAEASLNGCEITTAGYFVPSEHPTLYLSSEDYFQGSLYSGLFLILDQREDDRGHYVMLSNGVRISELEGPRILQVTGTVVWENDVPSMRNVHDLVTWPPRDALPGAARD